VKNGKEITKLVEDVEILVLSNGKEEETIDNEGPTITKVNIHEHKVKISYNNVLKPLYGGRCIEVDYRVRPSMDVGKLYVLEVNILNLIVRIIKL
jgi:hypothetical protein